MKRLPNNATAIERIEHWSIPEPNSGCWLWLGCMSETGYPLLNYKGAQVKGHRFSWQTYRGPIPEELFVLHRCDIPLCVNPDHLFVGTPLDNMKDRDRKGRGKTDVQNEHIAQKDILILLKTPIVMAATEGAVFVKMKTQGDTGASHQRRPSHEPL